MEETKPDHIISNPYQHEITNNIDLSNTKRIKSSSKNTKSDPSSTDKDPLTIDEIIHHLIDFPRLQKNNDDNIISDIKKIYKSYNCYIDEKTLLMATFESIMNFLNRNYKFSSIYKAEKVIIQNFKELQNNEKSYYYNYLFHIVFQQLFNQESLKNNYFRNIYVDEGNYNGLNFRFKNNYYEIQNSLIFSELFSSCNVVIDTDLNFLICKEYNIKQSLIDEEIRKFKLKCSKFIVQIKDENNANSIIIPYYPLGTLHKLFCTKSIEFSAIDKIIIILEITQALNDLNQRSEFHGNLCSENIYIDSNKDAYIGLFAYDIELENGQTRPNGPFYYRSPSKINNLSNWKEMNNNLRANQLDDYYSLGVMFFEIITGMIPYVLMKNKSRFERLNILRSTDEYSNYLSYLFSTQNNGLFDENSIFYGFKEIIQRCMKINSDQRYQSANEIIESIKKLPIYQQNKFEIESRIQNAINSANYKCSFANVVESYYLGQSQSKTVIEKTLSIYDNEFISFGVTDDIIKKIYETLEIQKDHDSTFIFNDIIDFIINEYEESVPICHYDDHISFLDSISIKANNELCNDVLSKNNHICYEYCIGIPSFSSLSDFSNMTEDQSLIWSYLMAKELSIIHSNNLYHGDLSENSVGIYYNQKTHTFVPSVILFYHYYEKGNKNHFNNNILLNNDSLTEKYQKKDMKQYFKIIQKFKGLSNYLLEKLKKSKSMCEVMYHIYNYATNYQNQEILNNFIDNIRNYNYSFFQLTYSDLQEIFQFARSSLITNQVILDKISSILQVIQIFLSNTISDVDSTIKENLAKIRNQTKCKIVSTNESIKNQFEDIKSKCSTLYEIIDSDIEIFSHNSVEIMNHETHEKTNINLDSKTQFNNFYTKKKKARKPKRKWLYKMLIKNLEISELNVRSVDLLLKRYLLNLNPNINFKIVVSIKNKMFSKYQDTQIRGENIIKIANKLGYHNTCYEDGNVVILIEAKTKVK